jgi:hypothetical protein
MGLVGWGKRRENTIGGRIRVEKKGQKERGVEEREREREEGAERERKGLMK